MSINFKIIPLFSQPLYVSKIQEVTYNLDAILKEGFIKGVEKDKKCLFSKNDNILENNNLIKLKEQIESDIENYLYKVLELPDNIKPKHISSWLVINKPGAFHNSHVHNNSFLSGSLYLKTPKNSGDIVFKISQSISTWTSSSIRPTPKSHNIYNSSRLTYTPEKFNIFLFPSHTEHEVSVNNSDEDREVISFNYMLEGIINNQHGNKLKIKVENV